MAEMKTSRALVCVVALGPPNAQLHGPLHRYPNSGGTATVAPTSFGIALTQAAFCQMVAALTAIR